MYIINDKVTNYETLPNGNQVCDNWIDAACDSSETKPTENIADGSIITETDTGDVYIFNAKTSTWVKMFGLKA